MGIPSALGVGACGTPPLNDQANAVVNGVFTSVGPGDWFAFRGPINIALWGSINTALTTTNGSLSASVVSGTNQAAGVAINSKNVPPGTTWAAFAGTSGTLALPALTYNGILNTQNAQVTLPPGSNVSALLGATVTVPSNAEQTTIPSGTTVIQILQTDITSTSNPRYEGRDGIIFLSSVPTTVSPYNKQFAKVPLRFQLTGNAVTSGTDNAAIFTGAGVVFTASIQIEYSFDGGNTALVANTGGTGSLAQYTAGTPVRVAFGEPEKNVLYRLNCYSYTAGNTVNYRMSTTGVAAESLSIATTIG